MSGFRALRPRPRGWPSRSPTSSGDRDITHLVASPLERAQETAAPLATRRGLEITVDERIIESSNVFEGQKFGPGVKTLRKPSAWRHLWNPMRPSWGEPYAEIAERMMAAMHDARDAARGHEAVLVSHQLPIWTTRLHVEDRSFLHDPRKRQCTLCSLTSLHFDGDRLVRVSYSEPAGDLIPTPRQAGAVLRRGRAGGGPPVTLRRRRSRLLLAAGVLALAGCTSLSGTGEKGFVSGDGQLTLRTAAEREQPIELTGEGLDGESLDLADYRGDARRHQGLGLLVRPLPRRGTGRRRGRGRARRRRPVRRHQPA